MAIAVTAVVNRPTYKSWTVTCLDADTTLTFNHNMGAAPDEVTITPIGAALAAAAIGMWSVVVSSTQITLNKLNVAGSGGAQAGTTVVLKVVAKLPHSIV
jgi:hypothetical protein